MNTSTHADIRMQQRGINHLSVELLMSYGKRAYQNGSQIITLDKKAKKKLFKEIKDIAANLEKLEKLYLIEADGVIVTTGIQQQRLY